MILTEPKVNVGEIPVKPAGGSGAVVRLRAELLANGQLGDVRIISEANKEEARAFLNAIRNVKFIPAQIDGKAFDSMYDFDFSFVTFSTRRA